MEIGWKGSKIITIVQYIRIMTWRNIWGNKKRNEISKAIPKSIKLPSFITRERHGNGPRNERALRGRAKLNREWKNQSRLPEANKKEIIRLGQVKRMFANTNLERNARGTQSSGCSCVGKWKSDLWRISGRASTFPGLFMLLPQHRNTSSIENGELSLRITVVDQIFCLSLGQWNSGRKRRNKNKSPRVHIDQEGVVGVRWIRSRQSSHFAYDLQVPNMTRCWVPKGMMGVHWKRVRRATHIQRQPSRSVLVVPKRGSNAIYLRDARARAHRV